MIKAIITYISTMAILCPCVLLFSEGSSFLPNLVGLTYIIVLFIVLRGKVAKKAYKALLSANKTFGL